MLKKEEFYYLHADLCKAIFSPKRLAIIDGLRSGRMNVSDLSKKLGTSQSNISQHMGILKSKGLVTSSLEGNGTYYAISNNKVLKAFDLVNGIIKDKYKNDNKLLGELIE